MSGELILIVDDSQQIVRHLTEVVLPTFGFRTEYALDGRSGLEKIYLEKPDLVMLDLNLPEMTGIDVLQAMVEQSINVPVVLMTGYGSEKSAIDAFRLGAKDYIIKPFSVDEVLETINRALMEKRLRQDKQQLAEQLRRAHVEMRRRVNEMSTLFGIGKAVTSLLSANKVLDRVLEAALYLSSAEESTIWLLDHEDKDKLRAFAKNGTQPMEQQAQLLSVKDSVVGRVMRSGRPLRDSAFSGKGIKLKTGYTARAVLYVTLTLRGQPVGVLGVSNSTEPRSFSERDEYLLSALADYAAIALENARVFQAADLALADGNEELRTILKITRTLTSSLDLNEVVRLTIQHIHDSWQIEASSLWLLDEEHNTLRVLANVGTPAETLAKFRVPLGKGFVGQVAQTGKPLYTNDVYNHKLHFREVDQQTGFRTGSILCVPLLFREKVIGVLQLLNKQDGGFSDRDVERAASIANAVAIGVTNSQLFQQAESGQKQLEATLEHNGNPIIITDAGDRILLLNQQARNRLALSRAAIGRPVAEVLALPELVSFLVQPVNGGDSRRTEIMLPDETVWLATLAPIPGYGRILILQDITYLKDLEKSKNYFVATVSHDLRAPLSSILGFAQALEEAGPLNEEQNAYLKRIVGSSKRMADLVNGLLDLAKVNAGMEQSVKICAVDDLAREAVADLQGQALAKHVTLEFTAQENLGPVQGDATLLRQAISNLIDNAIKFSPEGEVVKTHLSAEGASIQISVADNGAGISSDDLPFIFDKFYRVSNPGNTEGVGLGLTLVRSIVETHRGQVWVESHQGAGSTFVLRLPLATPVGEGTPNVDGKKAS